MLQSMTGYAQTESTADSLTVLVELRSYNSRYLDIVTRLPHGYNNLDERVRAQIGASVARGRVEARIQIDLSAGEQPGFEVNAPLASAYHKTLLALSDQLGFTDPVRLEQILQFNGIITPVEVARDAEAVWPTVQVCLGRALEALTAMRGKEGQHLAADIVARVDKIASELDLVRSESHHLMPIYQERLTARIAQLSEGVVEIDSARIAQEAAILADRSDISEEITRAESHLEQFRVLMDTDAPVGRNLNFLLQELHREFNTIGAKTEKAGVSHRVVTVKAELEKIREQIQNVE